MSTDNENATLAQRAAEGARIAAEARAISNHGAMMRCRGEGWIQATPLDAAGRRAVWMRRADGDDGGVELCGGREGDDCYVRLVPGMVLDARLIGEIMDPLERTAFALEDDAGYAEMQPRALLTVPVRRAWAEPDGDDGADAGEP